MTKEYDAWRKAYNSMPLLNEAMVEAAWNAATTLAQEKAGQQEPAYTEDQIAQACVYAEVSDSQYESMLISLQEQTK